MPSFPKLTQLKSPRDFLARLAELEIDLPFHHEVRSDAQAPLAAPVDVAGRRVGNRFAILPMEGWDGSRDGRPTELVRRRWQRFGASGAKLIWGVEAVAVSHEGRANPHQLVIAPETWPELGRAREALVAAHVERHRDDTDLLVGLQLTHSGRYARPDGEPRPRVAYRHPLLDAPVGVEDDRVVLADAELDRIVAAFVDAARLAHRAGFEFVDVKHCHGYLGHELLSAVDREGAYGGDLAGRTRFLRTVVQEIAREVPELLVGVRLSVFDFVPFHAGDGGVGAPRQEAEYRYAFGGDGTGTGIDLAESHRVVDQLRELGVRLLCVTAGSPYYVPHIQRPAQTPPSDGYEAPEDPLVGVARLLGAAREITQQHPDLLVVGSGMSYLQEWLPHVAQAAVAQGWATSVGLGRMALSYPDLPADVLAGRSLQRRLVCRTFSDCTTAPRNGMVSGCYPLDPFYKARPEHEELRRLKRDRQFPAS